MRKISEMMSRSLRTVFDICHDPRITDDEAYRHLIAQLADEKERIRINRLLGHKADLVLNKYLDACLEGEISPDKISVIATTAVKDKSFQQERLLADKPTEIVSSQGRIATDDRMVVAIEQVIIEQSRERERRALDVSIDNVCEDGASSTRAET